MRKLLVTLSLTTALFAASTAYFAYRLYGRGAVNSPDVAATQATHTAATPLGAETPAARADKPGSASSPPGSNTRVPVATAAGSRSAAAHEADKNRETMLPFARQFLARFADPVQHAALVSESRANLQRQYEPLNQRLKLDPATFNQVLDLLAEQGLQAQEQYFRCLVDASCDVNDQSRHPDVTDLDQNLLALLGTERMDDLKHYRNAIGERDSVAQLRGRLNDANLLRDEQAEKLIAALAQEHQQFQEAVSAQGATLHGWGTPLGTLWYTGDGISVDQQLSEAAAYSQRLRARAATLLTPQQLAIYIQMQDELLAAMTAYLRPAN